MTPEQKKTAAFVAVIGLKLLIICTVVAAAVSFVYTVTKDQCEKNLREEKRKAIVSIFESNTLDYDEVEDEQPETLYTVKDGENHLGYCVEVKSAGFGGDITMMVGFDRDGNILGVQIVSLSETPGLGAKVNDETYLSQYEGKSGNLSFKKDGGTVDAIGGATISSTAVLNGINRASEVLALDGLGVQP